MSHSTSRGLAARLRKRRAEIEQAILARVYGVAETVESADPVYLEGLRGAVRKALDYALGAAELGEPASVPAELRTQARLAARSGIGLDTVLRRYFGGFALICDFIIQEATGSEDSRAGANLQRVWRSEMAHFDRVIAAVAEEYTDEEKSRQRGTEQRRLERVTALLAGELGDLADLGYELDCWHIGAIATGSEVAGLVRELATLLDRRVLLVHEEEKTVWAWFGGQTKLAPREAVPRKKTDWPDQTVMTLGEPGWGIDGWRLTHRQAKAAMPIARREQPGPVHYGDVSLLASILQDEVLTSSLREIYLSPLAEQRDGGRVLRQTLYTYFETERNVSSTAAALKVNRKTVNNRLRLFEEQVGRSLKSCAAEVEAALQLEHLGDLTPSGL